MCILLLINEVVEEQTADLSLLMKTSNIKAVNVHVDVWNEIRWSFYTTWWKMKNIK